MKTSILRKIATAAAVAMILGCFTACAKKSEEEPASTDEVVEGTGTVNEQVDDSGPVKVENTEPDGGANTTLPNNTDTDDNDNYKQDSSGDQLKSDDSGVGTPSDTDQKSDDTDTGKDTDSSDDSDDGEIDYSDYLTVVSYNIKCAWYGETWAGVCENLKKVDADIVGLQEVDDGTSRSSQTPGDYSNQVQQLASDLGYKYWYFSQTIETSGGKYGHGILSKYPIKESTVTFFTNQKDEKRNVERHVLDVNGTELIFYNTHLAGILEQLAEIQTMMNKDFAKGKQIILTGDFNIRVSNMLGTLDSEKFLPLNGNDTFSFYLKSTQIDNIIVSTNVEDYYMDEGSQIGVIPMDEELEDSDHPMIYTYIKLKTK